MDHREQLGHRSGSTQAAPRGVGSMNTRACIRPWSPHDDERLRKLFDEGLTDELIAQRLQRTTTAVTYHRRSLGLKRQETRGRKRRGSNRRSSMPISQPLQEDI